MTVSAYAPATTTIDYVGQGKYKVWHPLDKDGDGGKIVNEGEVNKILKARGLTAVSGSFQSFEGLNLSSTNAAPIVNAGGSPTLPDVTGSTTATSALGGGLNWLSVTEGLNDAALMWMALSEMARTSMRDVKDAKALKHAMQKGKIEAKKGEIAATASRIEAEREEADRAFTWAVAGAVVAGLTAYLGGKTDWGSSPVAQAVATQMGTVVSSLGNKLSHNDGPIAEAKAQELREKNYQMQQEVMQQAIDEADSNYQEARELMKLALKIMTEHVERQTQVVQTITRG